VADGNRVSLGTFGHFLEGIGHMSAVTPRRALEQSAEYWGVDLYREYDVGDDEPLQLYHPEYFDDDTQQAYDELMLEVESWEHEDVPVYDAFGRPVMDADGAPKTVSQLKTPHRKIIDGKLVLQNFNVEMCKAMWGEEGYKRFKAAGGSANQVAVDLREMQVEFQKLMKERLKADPKSRNGAAGTQGLSDADRNGPAGQES